MSILAGVKKELKGHTNMSLHGCIRQMSLSRAQSHRHHADITVQLGDEEQYLVQSWDGHLETHVLCVKLVAQHFQQLEAVYVFEQPSSASTTLDEHHIQAMVKYRIVKADGTYWPYPEVC